MSWLLSVWFLVEHSGYPNVGSLRTGSKAGWLSGPSARLKPITTKGAGVVSSYPLKGANRDWPWQSHCPYLCIWGAVVIRIFPEELGNLPWSEGFSFLFFYLLDVPGHLSNLSLSLHPVLISCLFNMYIYHDQCWPFLAFLLNVSNLHSLKVPLSAPL